MPLRKVGRKLHFLVVSGPTREPLDPVRFLSNYSTGTMGRHLAEAVEKRKHKLTWVRCPEDAETARELEKKLKVLAPRCDVLIMAAAVCDVRPKTVSAGKIKKSSLKGIQFVRNPDILAGLGRKKKKGQVFVGFGLESKKILENGTRKLVQKKLDLILLQRATKKDKPFGDAKPNAWILSASGSGVELPRADKKMLAGVLVRSAERLARR